MRLGDERVTFLSLPPNFQTTENKALGYAVDQQMKKLMQFIHKVSVWSDLDNVDPKYYDYLAASIRAPFYSSEYDNDTKLAILKKALQTYMFAGTMLAEEQMLSNIFSDAKFVPFWEYGGEPYHFKIKVPFEPSEAMIAQFLTVLKRVKSQRSILDGMETKEYEIDISVYVATGEVHYTKLEEIDD